MVFPQGHNDDGQSRMMGRGGGSHARRRIPGLCVSVKIQTGKKSNKGLKNSGLAAKPMQTSMKPFAAAAAPWKIK